MNGCMGGGECVNSCVLGYRGLCVLVFYDKLD